MEFNQYIWHMSRANHVVAYCSLKQSKSKPLVLPLPSYCPLHSFSTSFLNMIYTPLCIFPPLICSNPLSAFCSHFSMENVLISSPLSSMWATQDIFTSHHQVSQHNSPASGNLLWNDDSPAAQILFPTSPPLPPLHHLSVSGPQDLGLENICHVLNPLLSTGNTRTCWF